jgi:hypothetical protein
VVSIAITRAAGLRFSLLLPPLSVEESFSFTRVLKRIFRPKRDEVTREWRKLHNKELRDMYTSQSIIRIINLRRMRWAGHVARMG